MSPWKNLPAMNETLAILGGGGHGKVVADAAMNSRRWASVVFYDDAYPEKTQVGEWSVVGPSEALIHDHRDFAGVIVAIGDNKLRAIKTLELQRAGANVVSVIHSTAVVSPKASVLAGSVVLAGAIINIDARVGKACIVNTGAIVEHDCFLHDGVHVSPGAALAGQTVVGEFSWIGIGAVTHHLVVIGSESVVGAGSVVLKSVPDKVTVAGNPAVILS